MLRLTFVVLLAATALSDARQAPSSSTIEKYPYHVSVENNDKHVCSGALVRKNVVLTAASCTNGLSTAKLKVRVGSDVMETGGSLLKVEKLVTHQRYLTNRKDYDIAIIVLKEPVTLSSKVKVATLPRGSNPPDAGESGTITGFGVFDGEKSGLEDTALTVSMLSKCKNQYASLIIYITERMFCAAGTSQRRNCHLDPGSPLVIDNKLVGLSAWEEKCGSSKYPTLFTNVAFFTKWLDKEVPE